MSERRSRIVVYGSVNIDMTVCAERLPAPGETVLGGQFRMSGGGKGANQAVAAARAGGDVSFVASVGQDDFGARALESFRKEGIDVSHVAQVAGQPTGVALICVSKDAENQIAVASGANALLAAEGIHASAAVLQGADIALAQLETPLPSVLAAARLATQMNVRFILNPAPAQPLAAELLEHVFLLTPNESECELLTGIRPQSQQSMEQAARVLMAKGVKHVVITLGRKGAFIASEGRSIHVEGFAVTPQDTTGAGDVFNGALAVGLGEGRSLEDAVRFANAAAALSVLRAGAQDAAPLRAQIDAQLA